MLKGFKDFIMRGNVVELAIAVVIGAAFQAVVAGFVNASSRRSSTPARGGNVERPRLLAPSWHEVNARRLEHDLHQLLDDHQRDHRRS